jgi:hypothetical protein
MQKHLIFSRNVNNTALTTERIQQLAPAVFSDTKAHGLSDRYASLNTAQLLPVLADFGYFPMQAAQKKSRKGEAQHSSHMLSFAKTYHTQDIIGDVRPEIILYNSHDGSSSVRLFAGCFRFICSNGIVAGDGFQSRMYHNAKAINGFEDMLASTVNSLPLLMERIEKLRSTKLMYSDAVEMARKGVQTRWKMFDDVITDMPYSTEGVPFGSYATEKTVRDALVVQRNEDDYMDAFTVFNRIQEAVVRGNAFVRSLTKVNTSHGGLMRKARPISSVSEGIRVNSELWAIADAYSGTAVEEVAPHGWAVAETAVA